MSQLDKLIAISSLVQGVYSRWRFRRLLSGLIIVAGLIVVSAIMVSSLLIGGFYAMYLALLHSSMNQQYAVLVTTLLFVLTTALIIGLTTLCLRRLRAMPAQLLRHSAMTARAGEAIDAFLDGFNGER